MGTHNHRMQLSGGVDLEIVARDPQGIDRGRGRWFGLDDEARVRGDWEAGLRLRGWVATTDDLAGDLAAHPGVFGEAVPLPSAEGPEFVFAIPADGSLPMDEAAPPRIHVPMGRGPMDHLPDLGAGLLALTLEHPEPGAVEALGTARGVDRPPGVVPGATLRYRAEIATAAGPRILT